MRGGPQVYLVEGSLDEYKKNGFVCFWKPDEENGFLGNWYESPFSLQGHQFRFQESYMMWSKAMLMGDEEVAAKILSEDIPARVKKLGQSVKPWDEDKWIANRCKIMYEGCMEKFKTHADLKAKLLATGDAILVEASPMDKIWGVGLAANNKDVRNVAKWKGLNLLGRVLMKVREDIKQMN